MAEQERPLWNSLEITKIVVSTATPVLLGIFGLWFTLQIEERRLDHQKSGIAASEALARDTSVVEKRVKLWDELGPRLNDIYAFSLYVGGWQGMSAADIVRRKREADRLFYSYRPFFSPDFIRAYDAYMQAAFQMNNGMGEDAKLRTSAEFRQNAELDRFSGDDNREQIHQAYFNLLRVVASEMRLDQPVTPDTPRLSNSQADS